jgi:molybdenum cofactor biosynthesis enzyme MoaA
MSKMKIQTMSIIAGNTACNAHCPFCISKMTPCEGIEQRLSGVNWRNFDIACKYAKQSDVSTVLITGKGEPTLFPEQITDYLKQLKDYDFPFIELQTNGLAFQQEKYSKYLSEWYELGMTTVALSVVHYEDERNREIYTPHGQYPNLEKTIDLLHSQGFSVRLSCMMAKGYIDSIESIDRLVDYAKENRVEQLTVRRVEKPENSRDAEAAKWVMEHYLPKEEIDKMRDYLDSNGKRMMELLHGAVVYDYKGQNICLNNCLTIDPKGETIRQLIFFPDGHLRYDWQYEGAILL